MKPIDPGIVGPSYQAPMTLQDAENAINWYLEVAEVDGAKEPVALLGTPGLQSVGPQIVSPGGGQIRGCWVLPGGNQALYVVGNSLVLASITVPATQNAIAQWSATVVANAILGNLLTNNGQVVIRDNGVLIAGKGGYALIVDGQYSYYYVLSGLTQTFTFTATTTNGSATLTLPGALPVGLIISPSATLSAASGSIPVGTYISSIDYNTPAITMTTAATATGSTTVTLTVLSFGQLTDPGFPANPSRIAFIEGWFLVNSGGTRTFQTNGPTAYTMTWPGSFFALKDSSTDNLITLYENNREAWMVGERTSEVWFNAGGASFAFQRVPGVGPQIGCAAQHSIARLGSALAWLAKNEQGENLVIRTEQYGWTRISNHAIEHAISSYPQISDAFAYAYEEEGHGFYVLTFPTADVTWVYDITASELLGKPCWHQRAAYDPVAGIYHRHRSNCYMDFANLRLVGDYQLGVLLQMSRKFFSEVIAGTTLPLRAQRRCKHVWKKVDRTRVSQSSLQIEFTPGVGLQTGQGQTPQAMLRWSNDGGFIWSSEHWRSIGRAGETKFRAKWNRLGAPRDRVYEVNFSDPTARDIIGATLFAESENTE